MKQRPIIIITISYIIGILGGIYLHLNISLFVCLFMLFMLFSLFKVRKCIVFICFTSVIISLFNISYREDKFMDLYQDIDEINAVGIVVSNAIEGEYYTSYIVKLKSVNNQLNYKNTKIILKIKTKDTIRLQYGNLISFKSDFSKADARRNYKGFSYFDYLKTKNIYGICNINDESIKILNKKSAFVGNMWINTIQNKIKNNINCFLKEDEAGIVLAILVGNTEQIDNIQKEIFSNANLSHILAISGMHVSYIIIAINMLLKKFDKRIGYFIFIIILLFFSIFTGGSPSVIRAVIMACLAIVSKLLYRKSDTLNNIFIACLILLIINPYYLFNLGFQLSFGGTLGIVLFNSKVIRNLSIICKKINISEKIISILSVSISANLIIFPILIYNFNSLSFVFLISNLLVTPILGLLCFLGYLTVFISFISINVAKFVAFFLNLVVKLFELIAKFSANLKILKFSITTPSVFCIIVIYIAIFYFMLYYKKSHNNIIKKFFVIITILVILSRIIVSINSDLIIYFIDVGQGDSTLIITPNNKKVLIDGGGSEFGDFDVGKNILVPYILDRKIKSIDYVFISHFDSDHCGGILYLLQELTVKNIIIGTQFEDNANLEKFKNIIKENKINTNVIEMGSKIYIDKEVYFDVLWPDSSNIISNNSINNNALVCKLVYKNFSMLFTGDIEKEAEQVLISKYKGTSKLNANVLKVGHHGSKSSSTQEFIELVQPQICVIGVGKNNKFGHPNNEVIERLQNLNCKIYRTDVNGEITIKVDKKIMVNVMNNFN